MGSRACAGGLDPRGHCRAARGETGAAGEGRRRSAARLDRELEHIRHPDSRARRRSQPRFPSTLARHPFLQPASLSPAPGDYSHRSRPSVGHRDRDLGSPITALAKASSWRRTLRTSSANHLGLYGVTAAPGQGRRRRIPIEEIDAITGPAIGRPGSATLPHARFGWASTSSATSFANLHERLRRSARARDIRDPAVCEADARAGTDRR